MRISSLFRGNSPTVSFEFFPPKTDAGRDLLLATIDHLAEVSPDFVSVTYGAGGSTRALSFETCCQIQEHTADHVMAHLTCVCHSLDEMGGIADQLWNQGIFNIMALRGDLPPGIDRETAFSDFRFAKDLIGFLKARHDFCIGSGCYPEGHTETPDLGVGIEHLKQKVDVGCDFLVTQMFFDNDSYFRFIELVRAAGITTPIIPGIMPVTGFAQLEKFESKFGVRLPGDLRNRVLARDGDQASIEQVGIEWAADQCRALLDGGAPGIHFYTLNKSSSTVEVCKRLGLMGSRDSETA
jgi:methylenetetrahydrofolate reductase (NADPH)